MAIRNFINHLISNVAICFTIFAPLSVKADEAAFKIFLKGQGLVQSGEFEKGVVEFEKACKMGLDIGCFNVASHYQGSFQPPDKPIIIDYLKAKDYLEIGCKDYNGVSCIALGKLFAEGNGVSIDLEKAHVYFSKTCQKTGHLGCYETAIDLANGKGAPIDIEQAQKLMVKACEKDNYAACIDYGKMLNTGDKFTKNPKLANKYFLKTCNSYLIFGCTELALNLIEGNGINRDVGRAIGILTPTCIKNNSDACYTLGILYSDDKIVTKDAKLSQDYLQKACDLKMDIACKELEKNAH